MKYELRARKINPNDDHILISRWHAPEGAYVRSDQDLLDVTTSKISITLRCEHDGYLHILKKSGQRAKIGEIFAVVYTDANEIPALSPTPSTPREGSGSPVRSIGFTRFSDAALRLIREHGLEEDLFSGMGLVTTDMVNAEIQRLTKENSAALPPLSMQTYRTQSTAGLKEAEIHQLRLGQNGLINSHLSVQFFARPLLERLESLGRGSMSLLPLILFEFSRLLKKNPSFTAFYRNEEIHFYDEVVLGLALDTGRGLKVAAVADAETMTPEQWKERITDLAMKDLRGQLSSEDLRETTVTVTDLSSLDILHFQPLINGAQSCILGIGGDRELPDHPMTLTINFDHRVLTGREVGEFLQELRRRLVSYSRL